MSAVDGLARFLFDRQAAQYGATDGMAELAWADDAIRGFWLDEAAAVLGHLDRGSRRRCASSGCRHSPSAHVEGGGRCLWSCGCSGWLDTKRHAWRASVCDSWLLATEVWRLHREAEAIGYATEEAEYEEQHPRPRLGDHMRALSYGTPPEQVAS